MILVTGGLGFIGSHILEELKAKDYDVIVLDNLESGSIENIKHIKKVKVVNHDIRERIEIKEEIDFILHQASIPSVSMSVENPVYTSRVNVIGTMNVLELARKKDAKVILASSSSVYGDAKPPIKESFPLNPKSPYAMDKLINEKHAKLYEELYGVKSICLRYFNVYGERQSQHYAGVVINFIKKIIEGENPIIYGDGSQLRDFVYVKDVAKANIKAMENIDKARGKSINIAYGKGISVLEVLKTIAKALDKEVTPIFKEERKGDIKESFADVSLAKELLGWEAKTEFKEGIKKTIQWVRNNF